MAGTDQAAATLQRLQEFNSALEEVNDSRTATFTASDESSTVEATVDGNLRLTGLHIDDGVLRLGAEEVGQRVESAIRTASEAARAAASAQHDQLAARLAGIAEEFKAAVEAD